MSSPLTPVISQVAASQTSLSGAQKQSPLQRGQQVPTDAEAKGQVHSTSQAASAQLKSDSKAEKVPQVPKKVERPYSADKRRAKPGLAPETEEQREGEAPREGGVDVTV